MSSPEFRLTPGALGYADLKRLTFGGDTFCLPDTAWTTRAAGAAAIGRIVDRGEAVYGLNTGFGKLAKTRIANDSLEALQRNLVLSHAAGVGEKLDDRVVRLILLLKANALARGYSGVRPEIVEALLALASAAVYPVIPAKGSVGASGDLAPLAHLAAVLLGEGNVRHEGEILPAAEGLALAGLSPTNLAAKEGLALLNGTQVSTALALTALFDAETMFRTALVTGALSIDAARGSDTPFDPRLHALRGHRGQIDCAAMYLKLLDGSEIRASHRIDDDRVQDPYCLRCQPQVMGACLDQFRYAAGVLEIEANAVSDNPILFAETEELISGGNFHAEPVALAADAIAVALAEVGAIAERRIAMLVDASLSGLPPFLTPDSGLNSGFMIAHVTAAALASENKSLAHPASVDSLPTSANQEDHVSMATFAARRLATIVENVGVIVAIEYLAAYQGISLLQPLQTSAPLSAALRPLGLRVAPYTQDRMLAPDIALATTLVGNGTVIGALTEIDLPSFHPSSK